MTDSSTESQTKSDKDTEVAGVDTPAIHTQDLAKRYGHVTALAGLTMTVPKGEIFGFLGPNGAGKTTSVKLLLGLTEPSAGQAWLLGAPIGDLAVRRRIGYLPELFRYQSFLTAREVLAFHCELARIPRSRWKEEVAEALQTVGLADRGDDRCETFSKGMQQRLGLGVALLGKPELLFLDEPTSALDPVGRHDVREITRQLRDRGTTVFLNSHLLSEVEMICDRAAVVDHGRVIALGTIHDLLRGADLVRVRMAGVNGKLGELKGFAAPSEDGEWMTFRDVGEDRVPDLVAEIVRLGGRVYAVEPRQQSLEDRFLQLLQEEDDK
jgi:ABC-2 type transport system ATP-binding protein